MGYYQPRCEQKQLSGCRMELIQETVVITAAQFNPSIVGEHWLISNGIVMDEDFQGARFFTPVMAQFSTADAEVLLVESRLQVVLKGSDDEAKYAAIQGIAAGIVRKLPETPYKSIGLNFDWKYEPLEAIRETSKRLFVNAESPIAQAFSSDDAAYGAYFSKDCLGFRLKLTILPVGKSVPEWVRFSFNCHADVSGTEDLLALLDAWKAAKGESERIVDLIEPSR